MYVLIIEEYVRANCGKYWGLVESTEKERLVDRSPPGAQSPYDSLLNSEIPRCHNRDSDRRFITLRRWLDQRKLLEQLCERPFWQGALSIVFFIGQERFNPLLLVDALGMFRKDHRVCVKCDSYNLSVRRAIRRRWINDCGREAGIDRHLNICVIHRQE